jgi:hypothetical protein
VGKDIVHVVLTDLYSVPVLPLRKLRHRKSKELDLIAAKEQRLGTDLGLDGSKFVPLSVDHLSSREERIKTLVPFTLYSTPFLLCLIVNSIAPSNPKIWSLLEYWEKFKTLSGSGGDGIPIKQMQQSLDIRTRLHGSL